MTNQEFIESIRLEGESWKTLSDFDGMYAVSNKGRVVSFARIYEKFSNKSNVTLHKKHRLLKPRLRNDMYYDVNIVKDGKRRKILLHRLIAIAFIPNPNNYPHIDHIDGNPSNNSLENLRWCTPKMNANNPIRFARESAAFKGKFNTKSSKKIVRIDSSGSSTIYPSIKEAGREGHTPANITRCCKGIVKHHHGFQWMYLSDWELLSNQDVNELSPNA